MTIEQLEHLGDGFSVAACGQTFVLDRTRVQQSPSGHDVSFVIAGTSLAPRIHLAGQQLASSSWEDVSAMLRRVVARVACRN